MNKIKIMALTALVAASSIALGATGDIGDTATKIGTQITAVTSFMVIGATLLGIVFLIVGGINLKKHGDNPQQVPLAKPLIFLASGALLFGLGSTSDVMQATLFADAGSRKSAGGGKFGDFK